MTGTTGTLNSAAAARSPRNPDLNRGLSGKDTPDLYSTLYGYFPLEKLDTIKSRDQEADT
jgi:hypothetical protein